MPPAILSIRNLSKTYAGGHQALQGVDLDVREGEILALLGPNGAGKTTLIGIVCGLVRATAGTVTIAGHDIERDWRQARAKVGLVPQELALAMFETVWATVTLSRGLYGKAPDPAYLEQLLRDLALWDKRDQKILTLSGGMKRRLLIAKALSHQPRVLFLDEPTAGVDVELRREMWAQVRRLRAAGVTVILTTHYLEEAEQMADRVAVINHGKLLLVEDKTKLMHQLGRKRLTLHLHEPLAELPPALAAHRLKRSDDGAALVFEYDIHAERMGVTQLLADLAAAGVRLKDLETAQSTLEDIFVDLIGSRA